MSQDNVEVVRRVRRARWVSVPSVAKALVVVASVGVCAVAAAPADGAFPGRNGRIAYSDPDGGVSSVWPNGANRQRLVRKGVSPQYSPRGDRIVVTSSFVKRVVNNPFVTRFDLTRLELVGAAGRHRRVLSGGNDDSPAWAPDGKRIVFYREDPCVKYSNAEADCPAEVQADEKWGILVRRRDGRTRVLTHNGGDPVWSPDGKLIIYTGITTGATGLYAVHPDGRRPRRLVNRSTFEGHDWSPDGRRIAITYGGVLENSVIGTVRRDGAGFHRLVRNGQSLAYSPDGRWIVFVRISALRGRMYRHCDETAGHMLWIMPTSGRRPRPLRYRSGQRICGSDPDWQPLR